MAKELNVEINIADYLDYETLKSIATDIFKNSIIRLMHDGDVAQRILTNSAYDIVCDILEKKHGINLEDELGNKCVKIINDENSVRFEMFRDYGDRKGIGLALLEKIVTEKLQVRLERVAENIIKNIKLDTKKFEKMVAEKVAEMVAKKLNR